MSDSLLINAIAVAAGVVAVGLAVTWLPAFVVKKAGIMKLRAACRGKLAITFDDGPGPMLTSALVELLRRHQAKATFFLVGFRALRSPESCELLVRHGHEIGCHTNMHFKPWRVAPWNAARDVKEGFMTLARWLDPGAAFRPPFGKLTTWSWLAARACGAPLSWWTCDGCDTHPQLPNPSIVAERIVRSGGGVVLLHSHDRGSDRHEYVLAVTELLLKAARVHGLELCTMSEIEMRGPVALGELR